MSLVDSGNHWEVTNGFIEDKNQLRLASKQAVLLSMFNDSELLQPFENSNGRLEVKKLAVARLRLLPGSVDFSELLQIFDRGKKAIGSDTDEAYINIFHSHASTGEDRAKIGEETLSIGLSGTAIARIQDPVSGGWSEFRLDAGDTLHFDNNQSPESERPLHLVKNVQEKDRVSLVINL
jgi:hypothetical protein